jgi:hypothetical protein
VDLHREHLSLLRRPPTTVTLLGDEPKNRPRDAGRVVALILALAPRATAATRS